MGIVHATKDAPLPASLSVTYSVPYRYMFDNIARLDDSGLKHKFRYSIFE